MRFSEIIERVWSGVFTHSGPEAVIEYLQKLGRLNANHQNNHERQAWQAYEVTAIFTAV